MARFGNRILAVLERIYGFRSQDKSISKFQLEVPIQPVHDVSRESELGAAWGQHQGYAIGGGQVNHVGASTEVTHYDPYAQVLAWGGFDPGAQPQGPEDMDLWLLNFACSVSAAAVTELTGDLVYPIMLPVTDYTNNRFPFLYMAHDHREFANYTGGGKGYVMMDSVAGTTGFFSRPYPLHLPYGVRIGLVSTTSGAATLEYRALLWMGRKGTTPPGMR